MISFRRRLLYSRDAREFSLRVEREEDLQTDRRRTFFWMEARRRADSKIAEASEKCGKGLLGLGYRFPAPHPLPRGRQSHDAMR